MDDTLACSRRAIVLHWICGKKLTAYEAEGSKPRVTKGPVMGWVEDPEALTALGHRAPSESSIYPESDEVTPYSIIPGRT